MEKDVLPYNKKQTLLRAQTWIGMSLNYLSPRSKNTRETLPPSKWELASNEFMTGRTGLPASIQKPLKGFVCMHVGGNSHYKKQSEVRRPGIFFINTISKTVFLQFLPSSKFSHGNCDATYKLDSWIRVKEIF